MEKLKNRHHDELDQSTSDYKTVLQELEELRKENYNLKEQLITAPKRKPRATTKKAE